MSAFVRRNPWTHTATRRLSSHHGGTLDCRPVAGPWRETRVQQPRPACASCELLGGLGSWVGGESKSGRGPKSSYPHAEKDAHNSTQAILDTGCHHSFWIRKH